VEGVLGVTKEITVKCRHETCHVRYCDKQAQLVKLEKPWAVGNFYSRCPDPGSFGFAYMALGLNTVDLNETSLIAWRRFLE